MLKRILATSGLTLTDIRHQRNVGADAIDDGGRYYELKVHQGPVPDEIRLTDAEIRRALSTEEYYLVIVGNVESGRADPEVRIVTDVLSQLRLEPSGSLVFSGVRAAQTLTYTFVAESDSDLETGSEASA